MLKHVEHEHGEHIGHKKLHPRNYFSFFYSFQLELCRMVPRTLYSKKSYVFYFSSLTVLIFEFPAILLLPRNIRTFQDAIHLLKQLSLSKKFFTSVSIMSHSFKFIY